MTQQQQILKHLQRGNTLTPMSALNLFGTFRLGARIYDLKRQGHQIKTRLIWLKGSRRRVAMYSL